MSLESAKDATTDGRFNLLSALAARLGTRKVIFLSPSVGPGARGDAAHLVTSTCRSTTIGCWAAKGQLARRHYTLLRQVRDLLDEVPQRVSVAVVSPLALLRELFTVSGAGTMIRKGSTHRAPQHASTASIASGCAALLGVGLRQAAEGRGAWSAGWSGSTSRRTTWARRCCRPAPIGPYLSKFAVERTAQGEGIGGDLWSVIVRDYPSVFWRARPDNPITPWYAKQCDGLHRFPEWHVFWKGLPPERVRGGHRLRLLAAAGLRQRIRYEFVSGSPLRSRATTNASAVFSLAYASSAFSGELTSRALADRIRSPVRNPRRSRGPFGRTL